ncbi:hypothetical protein O181_042083 [Austropuccinia psidii MF-1]|uniref:Uncharacterized protein n=1 Tax=Austropuccinia psidii MF-1 TaxID=1389203 RepID=A0A9Q3DIN4_9BASI|nr:hypothetical protein [Austropuccinia psidii MF-1]
MNEHQYQQPHAHNHEGFFDASITDSSPYGPTDQSVCVKDVTHPGSNTRNEALFRFPVSPEPTQTILQDGDRCSQLLVTHSSHLSSSIQAGSAFKERCCTKKEIAEDSIRRQEANVQFDPKYKGRGDWNLPFVELDFANICTYLENQENYNDLFGNSKKQSRGKKKNTRAQAFKRFVMYLNVNHEGGTLELSGCNLQQRWKMYKPKFMDTAVVFHTIIISFKLTRKNKNIELNISDIFEDFRELKGV